MLIKTLLYKKGLGKMSMKLRPNDTLSRSKYIVYGNTRRNNVTNLHFFFQYNASRTVVPSQSTVRELIAGRLQIVLKFH